MKKVDKIFLCEVGLRDGLQNEATCLTVAQKLELIHELEDCGYKTIEVGSFMNPKLVPQMANTDDVFANLTQKDGIEYRALVANARGGERAINCGCRKVKLNVSASREHNIANLNKVPEETVAAFKSCVDLAVSNDIDISGSISMAFGSPWEYRIEIDEIKRITDAYVATGITEISLSDTTGMGTPWQVNKMCLEMKKCYSAIRWNLHFHNTRGMGIANIVAGLDAGFVFFDTSFAGTGGCPFVPEAVGNVSSEDVAHMCCESAISTGLDLDKVIALGRKVEKLIGHQGNSYVLRAGKSGELIKTLVN